MYMVCITYNILYYVNNKYCIIKYIPDASMSILKICAFKF
jgi:hypothetical protein